MTFRDIKTFEELKQFNETGKIAVTDIRIFDRLYTELCILCRFVFMCKVSAGLIIDDLIRLESMLLIGEDDFDCFSENDKRRASLLLAQRVALYEDLFREMSDEQNSDYHSAAIFLGEQLYKLGLFEPWETFLKNSEDRIIPEHVPLNWGHRRKTNHWLGEIMYHNYLRR